MLDKRRRGSNDRAVGELFGQICRGLAGIPAIQFVERSIDEDLPESRVAYIFSNNGFEMSCDSNEDIRSIFLNAETVDQGLIDIPLFADRMRVLSLLGTPSKCGDAHVHPILGEYGPWDRFARVGYAIHVQYQPHEDKISLITLMRGDVVP